LWEWHSPELLENIKLPESLSFIKEIPKTLMEWTDETLTPLLNISAPTNPESIKQHIIQLQKNRR